jgi:iron complex outermembrane receptor protein
MRHLLTIALCTVSFAATAQNASLDSIVVRENRLQIPYNSANRDIQILTRQMIKALPVKSINELLAYAAGVDIRQRGPWGTQADVSVDGSTFDQVLILLNGIKLSDPQTGHHKLNLPVPLAAIERIEVLRGASARTYGVNAQAGAINIVTRIPNHNSIEGELYAGSSFEKDTATGKTYSAWGAQAAGSIAAENQSHMFSISYQRGNGYRYNTEFEAYRLFYQNDIVLDSRNTLQAIGGYISNAFGASLYYAAPNDKEATETVQTAIAGLSWIHKPSPRLTITPRLSFRYNKDDYIYIRQRPEVYHNIHETNVLSGEVNATYQAGPGTIGAGGEWRREGISSNSLGKRNRDNLGFYAEYRYQFNTRLTATAGIYLNSNSDFGTQLLPGAEAGYALTKHWRIIGSAGTGQRQPTYTDLYYKGPANIGNDTLQPEQAIYTEAAVAYNHPVISFRGSYAYRRTTDFIDWVRNAETDPWQPRNYARINTRILSLRAAYELGRHLKLPSGYELRLQLSYTYLDPSLQSEDGLRTKYTIDALQHQAVASLNTVLWNNVQLGVTSRYQQRLNAIDYWLVDARIGYRIKEFLFYADGNNLLSTRYYESGAVPLPGRWLAMGIRYSR